MSVRIAAVFILLWLNKSSLTPEKTAFLIVLAMTISEVFSFAFLGLYYKIYQKKHCAPNAEDTAHISNIQNIPNRQSYSAKRKTKKSIASEIIRIAVPISASSLLMTIISSVNTILLPKRLVVSGMTQTQAIETLGILMGMTAPLVTIPVIFIGPLMNVIFPRIASAKKLGKTDEMRGKITKTLQTCSFLTFPAMGAVETC